MRLPFRMSVIHQIARRTERLLSAHVAVELGAGGSAQIALRIGKFLICNDWIAINLQSGTDSRWQSIKSLTRLTSRLLGRTGCVRVMLLQRKFNYLVRRIRWRILRFRGHWCWNPRFEFSAVLQQDPKVKILHLCRTRNSSFVFTL